MTCDRFSGRTDRLRLPVHLAAIILGVAFATLVGTVALAQVPSEHDGEVDVQYEDSMSAPRLLHVLKRDDGRRIQLRFTGKAPRLFTGTRVRVRGRLSADTAMLATDASSVQVTALASPNTFGPQSTLVMLINFQDNTAEPYSVASANDVTFTQASNYYLENSYGQTSLSGRVVGWLTVAANSTVCDTTTWATLADQAAARAGVDLSLYARRIYGFPWTAACSWWGLGTIGGGTPSYPSRAWINGTYSLRVVAHELGHNFGDLHSHANACDGSSGCTFYEYGDDRDTMGSVTAHFNAFQKENVGWLNYGSSPGIATVTASSNYALEPYETLGAGLPKALKIVKSVNPQTGRRSYYYVEMRTSRGFDANLVPGIVVRTATEGDGDSSVQVDLDPVSATFDGLLEVGQTFTDSAIGLSITPLSSDAAGALVNITFDPAACTRAKPSVVVSPGVSPLLARGGAFTYAVNMTNNNGANCAPSRFSVGAGVPTGWTSTLTSSSLVVNPGASVSMMLEVRSASATTDGSYTISVFGTDSGDETWAGSGTTTHMVASALSVTASTDSSRYSRTQTVVATSAVTAGSAVVPGTNVTFRFIKSDGKVVTMSAVAGPSGTASSSLRLSRKDPTGTYRVDVSASRDGFTGSSSASFAVVK